MIAFVSKLYDNASPSKSVPLSVITILWSSFVIPDKPAVATGASLTAFTVTVKLW